MLLTGLNDALWYTTCLHNVFFGFVLIARRDVVSRQLACHGLNSDNHIGTLDVPEWQCICYPSLVDMHDDLCLCTETVWFSTLVISM